MWDRLTPSVPDCGSGAWSRDTKRRSDGQGEAELRDRFRPGLEPLPVSATSRILQRAWLKEDQVSGGDQVRAPCQVGTTTSLLARVSVAGTGPPLFS
jgi:hypothetical protein